jgi:hypothetical protein
MNVSVLRLTSAKSSAPAELAHRSQREDLWFLHVRRIYVVQDLAQVVLNKEV